jgi:hypothetical protein
VITGYYDSRIEEILKNTGQHAYEAAVELLGCRNPSASSAAVDASTATSTAAMMANEATTSNDPSSPSPIKDASWDDVVVSVDATNSLTKTSFTRLKSIAGILSHKLQVKHLLTFCTANGINSMRNKPKLAVCEAIVKMKVRINL